MFTASPTFIIVYEDGKRINDKNGSSCLYTIAYFCSGNVCHGWPGLSVPIKGLKAALSVGPNDFRAM